ncbi:MAG: ferredoxin:glutaredoxin reductase [Candidatus Thermoplasmatota archaeon]|nr:ferredoxin:glutaredoxin reductase [Candidatus Thermoplasmatota archaeon]MBU1941101.1 ferredoxin:glutaredoxin reductase [Candidatus Thermoplasmatota archaeon]
MKDNAKKNGYYLCPDPDLLKNLLNGLKTNDDRYGYSACPCRIACGNKQYDADIICPCEYRDVDVNEYGMCYCGLFVNKAFHDAPKEMGSIPERRPIEIQDAAMDATTKPAKSRQSKQNKNIQIWRCVVCGYLAARELPPPICPICKAKAERFEPFTLK